MKLKIRLQPKQGQVYDWMESGRATWIGAGGGRGSAKSGGADRIALALSIDQPGIVSCVVMRNFDQVRKYHIEPLMRTYPVLEDHFTISTSKLKIPCGEVSSEIDFSYAENLADVERRFRSANYKYIIVDQAEQFTPEELLEMKNACRWPGGGAKMLLLFNMGGACIQTLRKWFYDREYNERQDPEDYAFIHMFPWDNVEWSRDALAADGLTEEDYYGWTDADRMLYCATRSDYGKTLNSLDDALRNRDWFASWDSLEGAFFGRVFDLASTRLDPVLVPMALNDWDTRWTSTDWGKSHYCATLWHGRTTMSPERIKHLLGWTVSRPLTAIITYREWITNEMTSEQVGRGIGQRTPDAERRQIKDYFLSPDAFGERDSPNTTAMKLGKELRAFGMPEPFPADTDRPGGYGLMYTLLANTKAHGGMGDDIWLISANCAELLAAIPALMRDPKKLDDVLKTDLSQARVEQDVSESARYGLKSLLAPRKTAPYPVRAHEEMVKWQDPTTRAIKMREFELKEKRKVTTQHRWRGH